MFFPFPRARRRPAPRPRIPRTVTVLLALAVAAAATAVVGAQSIGPTSGLPLPRFVSLAADEVNVRTGPGVRYPIAWVFVRAGMPVEITAEFGHWRKIRDLDGAEGWAHKSLLSGRRTALITGAVRTLYRKPDRRSAPVLRAEAGVQGALLGCREEWCELRIAGQRGWLARADLWGVYGSETFD